MKSEEESIPMLMKHDPAEFKADAVALYRPRPGTTFAEIADDLGLNRETPHGWTHEDGTPNDRRYPRRPSAAQQRPCPPPSRWSKEQAAARPGLRPGKEHEIPREASACFAGEMTW
ncbi:hypothetical protein [Halostreptopolyspora alba]|uniref:Transposase n=1 Tax=Halostreptopolyspora alba TaxID=2487137 RepID=A0A3N0E8T8_9ACTN|nr:hypothetical protein EFW17_13375 [Nocardiopsaceae bacterium YIM 96095]